MIIEGEYPGCDLDELKDEIVSRIEPEDEPDELIDNPIWKRFHFTRIKKERIESGIAERRADIRWSQIAPGVFK